MTLYHCSVCNAVELFCNWLCKSKHGPEKVKQTTPLDAALQLHIAGNAVFLQDWVTYAFMTVTHLGS